MCQWNVLLDCESILLCRNSGQCNKHVACLPVSFNPMASLNVPHATQQLMATFSNDFLVFSATAISSYCMLVGVEMSCQQRPTSGKWNIIFFFISGTLIECSISNNGLLGSQWVYSIYLHLLYTVIFNLRVQPIWKQSLHFCAHVQAGAGKSIEPIVSNCFSASFLLLLIYEMSSTYYINLAFDFNFKIFF